MTLENLFAIEDVLSSNCAVYMHLSNFKGERDLKDLLEAENVDEVIKQYNGKAIIVWCENELDREDLWKKLYREVHIFGNERMRVWFVNTKNTVNLIIPIN